MKIIVMIFVGASYGFITAAGMFAVLMTVGLVPRFIERTHTSEYLQCYEDMIVVGNIFGTLWSLFPEYMQIGAFLQNYLPEMLLLTAGVGFFGQITYGLFSGMFIGCLALSIAEILDSIPIMSRRFSFQYGMGIVLLCMAIGKLCGSFFYFWEELYRVS